MDSPRTLLALSGLGFLSLWAVAYVNGTIDAFFLAQATAKLPDGTQLRTVYTAYPIVDHQLLPLFAFFEVVINSKEQAPRLLFFYICSAIAAANTWVLIESRRRGVRNLFLRHTIIFIFLWNTAGAAFIAPIYFFLIARSGHTKRDPTIPLNEARAFIPTAVANYLFVLILFIPRWLDWSTHEHHGYLGLFLFTPLFMVFVLVVFSRPGTTLTVLETPKRKTAPNEDISWVISAFQVTGIIAAAIHLYIVGTALLTPATKDDHLGLTRLFVPAPLKVFSAPPGSYDAMLEGCHLFSQLDLWVAAAAIIVFTHNLLQSASGGSSQPKNELALITLGTLVFGPAAAGSFALATRETRLRGHEQMERKRK